MRDIHLNMGLNEAQTLSYIALALICMQCPEDFTSGKEHLNASGPDNNKTYFVGNTVL